MKKVLVALDHSARASEVLAHAASIAAGMGAEIYLLRAVGLPLELPADAYRSSPNEIVESLRASSARELEGITASLEPTQVVHILVRTGVPWAAICDSAKEHDVDLVVIGSHRYDAIDHVLGTTAAKVANHIDRSLLIVRPARVPDPAA